MAGKQGVTIIIAGEDKSGAVLDAVNKHLSETKAKGEEAGKSLEKMGEKMMHGLEAAGIALGARELVEGLKHVIETSVEMGMEIGHLSQQTGISVQTLSVLRYTAEQTGVSLEVVSKAFKKISTDIFEWSHGQKLAGEAFGDLGISLEDVKAKGQDMYGILAMVADKFRDMPDGPHKLALAVQLFGRAGQQMIPVLDQGAAGLEKFRSEAERLGLVMSEQDVKNMEELHGKLVLLKESATGAALGFSEGLTPALVGIADEFRSASNGADIWRTAGKNAGLLALGVAGAFQQVGSTVRASYDDLLVFAATMDKVTHFTPRFLIPQDQRKAYDEHQNYAQQTIDAARREHDSILTEEQSFNQRILALQDQIRNPSRSDNLLEYLRSADTRAAAAGLSGADSPAGGGYSTPGVAGPDARMEAALQKWDATLHLTADIRKQAEQNLADARASAAADAETQRLAGQKDWDAFTAQNSGVDTSIFQGSKLPDVVLGKQPPDYTALRDAGEKFAHSIFDPLFNVGEKWNQQWKQIQQGLLRDIGQIAEGKVMGALFGDSEGRGGRGLSGGSWDGNPNQPGKRSGLASGALEALGGLFHRPKAGVTSNGGVGAGAGTVATAAASLMQTGKGSAGAGVQVVLNNQGSPLQATATQQTSMNGAEEQVVQIVLKDLETNGPMAQGITGLMGLT